jgi:serine phosphatase RsbU (regulator of sigma subunit)
VDLDTFDIDSLERRILRVENWLILLSIAAIATADYFTGRDISLGPLFLIPLSYSALTNRARTTILLFALCVVLRQTFGPIGDSANPWSELVRDLGIAGIFVLTVVYLGKLGRERRLFFQYARRQRDELAQEVDVAADVQRRLLALSHAPDGSLDVAARTEQLHSVGGDYYDFVDLGEGLTAVVVADVAGKGLQAALLMPAVRIALRAIVAREEDPSAILRELNTVLFDTTEIRHYATLFYAAIDSRTGTIRYVNAGHLPPLLVEGDGRTRWLEEGGTPVGLVEGARYQSGEVELTADGVLVLYTDGVTETLNGDGEHFGAERLMRVVLDNRSKAASEIIDAIEAAIGRFAGGLEPSDDTTLIVARRPRGSASNVVGA